MPLSKIKTSEKSGNEHFHLDSEALDATLLSFWQWSSSELLGNALRSVLAEYIVSIDVGYKNSAREEWDANPLPKSTARGTGFKPREVACLYVENNQWLDKRIRP